MNDVEMVDLGNNSTVDLNSMSDIKDEKLFDNFDSSDLPEFNPDDYPDDGKKTKIFYLDDNHNFVSEEEATKSVIQVYDKDDNLIEEVWSYKNQEGEELEDNVEYKTVYVDENDNEVKEEEAVYVKFEKYVDNELVSTDKYPVSKSDTNNFSL